MKLPISVLTAFAAGTLAGQATITTYSEYHFGEDGVALPPKDGSGNLRHYTGVSGTGAVVGAADFSPAPVSTSFIRTDTGTNVGWFNGPFAGLDPFNFAVGIYVRVASNTVGARGHVLTLGRGAGSVRISMTADGWRANFESADVAVPEGDLIGATVPVTDNTWVHLAVIRQSDATGFYVDGVQQGALETLTFPVHANTGHLSVNPGGGTFFDGQLDEMRVVSFTFDEPISSIVTALKGIDSDMDGLYDNFEKRIIDFSAGDAITSLADVLPGGDFDGDLTTNLEEQNAATDPTNPSDHPPLDLDHDGLLDEFEQRIINFSAVDSFNTLADVRPGDDFDADFWTNLEEQTKKTDPTNAADPGIDQDRDGLLDSFEKRIIDFSLTDAFNTIADVHPGDDFDGDGLSNLAEQTRGSDPTNPLDPFGPPPDVLTLLAYWNFNDSSLPDTAADRVAGYPGTLSGGAAYTADMGGRTGAAGDRAVDFGIAAGAQRVLVSAPAFLTAVNAATSRDRLAVSFWQKKVNASNSSSFWFQTPDGVRGFQSHTPYGNGIVYFDHRLTNVATGYSRLQFTPSPVPDWTTWHHLYFVKDGTTKQVFLNGVSIGSAVPPVGMATNISALSIGNYFSGNFNTQGLIDDFAVFDRALTTGQIAALAAGATPSSLIGPEPDFGIKSIIRKGNLVTLTWTSFARDTYKIKYSFDLKNWDADAGDGIPPEAGSTTTTREINLSIYGIDNEPRLYFRIER